MDFDLAFEEAGVDGLDFGELRLGENAAQVDVAIGVEALPLFLAHLVAIPVPSFECVQAPLILTAVARRVRGGP